MGLAHANLTLANPTRRDLAPIAVQALADTGAVHLCMPGHGGSQFGSRMMGQWVSSRAHSSEDRPSDRERARMAPAKNRSTGRERRFQGEAACR